MSERPAWLSRALDLYPEHDRPEPIWRQGTPQCHEECVQHDGKRCRLIGFRPESLCEPTVSAMSVLLNEDGVKP